MSPHTFLARLCALVPVPRAHTVLYYGVLSAHHGLRSAVVPRADEPAPEPKQLALFVPRGHLDFPSTTTLLGAQLRDAAPSRMSWMTLLASVFRIDTSVCPRCRGPMKVTRFVTTPDDIAAELHGARPPPRGVASSCSRLCPERCGLDVWTRAVSPRVRLGVPGFWPPSLRAALRARLSPRCLRARPVVRLLLSASDGQPFREASCEPASAVGQ